MSAFGALSLSRSEDPLADDLDEMMGDAASMEREEEEEEGEDEEEEEEEEEEGSRRKRLKASDFDGKVADRKSFQRGGGGC